MELAERLLDLMAFLLASRRPVSASAIFDAFPNEYDGSFQARERKFSRDKEMLRDLGIPLIRVDAGDDMEEAGYRIDRDTFYLPELQFTPEEKAALFAVGAAAIQGAFPLKSELAHALTKLRATHGDGEERARPLVFADVPGTGEFQELFARAVAERRKLRLRYPPEEAERIVDPYAFAARRGRFAVVGFCHLRGGIRTFYADRVTECVLEGTAGKPQFDIPAGFDAADHLPTYPWQLRIHDPIEVDLEFAPELAQSGPQTLGFAPGGPFRVTNVEGLLSQLMALGPGVRVKGPREVRLRLSEKLHLLQSQLGGFS